MSKIRWLVLSVAAGWIVARLFAATITVTNTNDSGPGSLRQAILDAADGGTINFSVTGTITLTSGELLINKSLTISGPGQSQLTISGNNASRVFAIGAGAYDVSFSGLTVANGLSQPTDADNPGTGAGLRNDSTGTVTLTNCTFTNNLVKGEIVGANQQIGGNGGAVFNSAGTLTVTNCTLSTNQAFLQGDTSDSSGGEGGAVFNASGATLNITGSQLLNNSAESGIPAVVGPVNGGGGTTFGNVETAGGAISNVGTLNLATSTLTGNKVDNGTWTATPGSTAIVDINGGGGAVANLGGTATVTGCTISGNSVIGPALQGIVTTVLPSGGGAILNKPFAAPTATLAVQNTTLADNQVTGPQELTGCTTCGGEPAGALAVGGAVCDFFGSTSLTNCTAAGNSVTAYLLLDSGSAAGPDRAQGGGIAPFGGGTTLSTTYCTIANNSTA
ncbi:MAG: hypothetical protein JO354_07115, partial [Verrucomicrobia bacterium]|nr:hypothetical protein [Verrucomicrobiota bacterium]